jgi:hypothetical protein
MKSVFPDGLPNDCNKMTDLQKIKMVGNGADFIELMRQKITVIHRVVEDDQAQEQLFAPVKKWFSLHPGAMQAYSSEIASVIFDEREKLALQQINSYFAANPQQQDVILMYGSDHNFSLYPNLFPPQCVLVPFDFQKDWLGQSRSSGVYQPDTTAGPKATR